MFKELKRSIYSKLFRVSGFELRVCYTRLSSCANRTYCPQSLHIPHSYMTHQKFLSALAAGMMAFSVAAPAFAVGTAEEVLIKLSEYEETDLCVKKSGREAGRCMTDVLKRIKQLQDEFDDALRIKRREWDKANGHLGIGNERKIAFKEYMKGITEIRNTFKKRQKALEQRFFDENTVTRKNIPDVEPKDSYKAQIDMAAALAKCEGAYTKEATIRICVRQAVRMATAKGIRGTK